MRALMLFHVVFARKGFVAGGAVDVFLASVFLAVAGGVAGRGECAMARVAGCVRAGVFFLGRLRGCRGWCGGCWFVGPGGWCCR